MPMGGRAQDLRGRGLPPWTLFKIWHISPISIFAGYFGVCQVYFEIYIYIYIKIIFDFVFLRGSISIMKRKPFNNIDAVPRSQWNLIIIALKHKKFETANRLLNETLVKIKDIKDFEVFLLKRKLCAEAGI